MCVQYIGGCSVPQGVFSTSLGYRRDIMLTYPPCIMGVNYIGGCSVHQGDVQYIRGMFSTSGGVQYIVGPA